jgi:hypothetical protein
MAALFNNGRLSPVAVTVAPVMPGQVPALDQVGMPDALRPSIQPSTQPMMNVNGAKANDMDGSPVVVAPPIPVQGPQPVNTMAPVAYAMEQYKEPGDPFTAAAEGMVNANQYRQQQAVDKAKQADAAKLLDGYPDLQNAVSKGTIDLPTALNMKVTRDAAQGKTDRKSQIIDYLTKAGDTDIAEQFKSGAIDESGVSSALIEKDKKSGASLGDPNLPEVTVDKQGRADPAAQKEFLGGLNAQDATNVKAIANYQMDLNTISIRNGERARIAALVKQYDPSYVTSQYPAASKMRSSLTSGDYSKTLQSANLVIQHLNTMKMSFDKMGNMGGIGTLANGPLNAGKEALGDKNIAAFNTARDGVATELSKVFRGTGAMSEKEIEEWKSNFNRDMSPEAMQASIQQAMEMLNARLDTVKAAYNNALGRPQDFTFLTSKTVDALKNLNIDASALDPLVDDANAADLTAGFRNEDGSAGTRAPPPDPAPADGQPAAPAAAPGPQAAPAAPTAPPVSMTPRGVTPDEAKAAARPTTPAEFDALPKGTLYIDPGDNQPHWKL